MPYLGINEPGTHSIPHTSTCILVLGPKSAAYAVWISLQRHRILSGSGLRCPSRPPRCKLLGPRGSAAPAAPRGVLRPDLSRPTKALTAVGPRRGSRACCYSSGSPGLRITRMSLCKCDTIRHHTTRRDTTRRDTTRHGTKRHDREKQDTTRHDTTRHE